MRSFFTFTVPARVDVPRRAVRRERLFRTDESYTTPLFADSHVSLSFSFGSGYRVDGLWTQAEERNSGHVIGPMSAAHPAAHGDQVVEVGVYFRAVQANRFLPASAFELTDRILPLSDLWGREAISLESRLAAATCDDQLVNRLECALLRRLHGHPDRRVSVDLPALAAFVQQRHGMVTIAEVANQAGISRQHLRRIFCEGTGLSPKLFCRLARFRAALAFAAEGQRRNGAGIAAELGYVDQSHMIAEFREFSGLTPGSLLLQRLVHPFTGGSGDTGDTVHR